MSKYKLFLSLFLVGLALSGILYSTNVQAAYSLASRLSGYILLQVESLGEAWYVIPTEQKMVYMKDGSVAYQIMREVSLGITDANLAKIPVGIEARFNDVDTDGDGLSDNLEKGLDTDPLKADTDNDGFKDGDEIKNNYSPLGSAKLVYNQALVNRLRGYILLQVEKQGQAWYVNPKDGKRYYMQDGPAAYNIMRFLSLGITNANLNLISKSARTFNVDTSYNNADQSNQGNNNNNNPTSTPTSTPPVNNPGGGGGGGGGGGSNPPATPVPDTQDPSVPQGLVATASTGQIALTWTASSDNVGVTGYNILRSTTDGSGYTQLTTVNTNSYNNTGLNPTTTYYYVVQAYDATGNTSANSTQAQATTPTTSDSSIPSIPSNLSATLSGTQASLSWTASTDNVGVTGYNILRSTINGSPYTQIGTSNTNSFVNTGLSYSTSYFYVVQSYDAANNVSANSNQAQVSVGPAPDNTAPTIPSNLQANASGSQIALTWTASTDAVGVTGYSIWRSTVNGSNYVQIGTSVSNSYTNTGLSNGTYYYVVRAYDAVGNTSINSNQASGTISSSTAVCEATGGAHCYYIATNGSDSNNGSISAPFASTNPIINSIAPGDYIYFRGGTYGSAAKGQVVSTSNPPYFYTVAHITRSGTSGYPITFKAYPGESPVLDMYNINPEFNQNLASDPISSPVHSPDNAFYIYNADHIVVSGFEIAHGSIYVRSSDYTWIENNHIHDLLSDRDNNGLVILYFTEHAYVRNNDLHDTYQRSIADGSGGWMVNNIKSHVDAQHNGCITTLSGDIYVGYGHESSGPFEFTSNDIHDCPVHLFLKNPQGQLVNADGINILIKDNYFYGAGRLADYFSASNVLVENNLFKDVDGITGMGGDEYTGSQSMINEIYARNITFKNNVFSSAAIMIRMRGLGFRVANGIYSTALEDKLKFYNNVVVIEGASTPGIFGWDQGGYVFGNSYATMIDPQHSPSKTLSRIDSMNNCYVNQQGSNLALLKHWYNGHETITGYSHATARSVYGINGSGDLLPTDTSLTTHFTNPNNNDFSIKSTSPCAAIANVGLLNPEMFVY